MENAIEELKTRIRFKDTTNVGDVVLVVHEPMDDQSPMGLTYAVVTGFERDTSKRDEWWYVRVSFLAIPPQEKVLILQQPHFTGEIFTMGGKKVFIKALDFKTGEQPAQDDPTSGPGKSRGGLRVVKS